MAKRLQITQTRSGLGRKKDQGRTLIALGLKKHQQTVIHNDTPEIRGMINKVGYLLDVQEID